MNLYNHTDTVIDDAGNSVGGATITVYLQGTTSLATIYADDAESALQNPYVAGPAGEFSFYAQRGRYDVKVSFTYSGSPVSVTRRDVMMGDQYTEQVISSKVAAKTITPVSTRHLRMDGSTWLAVTGASAGAYADNADGTAFGTIVIPAGGNGSSAWLREHNDVVNLAWFGGSPALADNSTALQLAIDSFAGRTATVDSYSRGGGISVGAGVWNFQSPVLIRLGDAGIRLFGVTRDATIFNIDHSGIGIDVSSSGSPVKPSISIERIGIRSTELLRTAGSMAISFGWAIFWSIRDCGFAAAQQYGIYADSTLDGEIYNCLFQAAAGNIGFDTAIHCEYGSGGAANELTFRKVQIEDANSKAIHIYQGEVVSILDCLIQSNERDGIVYDKVASLNIERTYFEGNGQSNTADSADIKDDATLGLSNNVNIQKNHFSGDLSAAPYRILDAQDTRGFSFKYNDLRGGASQIIRVNISAGSINGDISHNRAAVDPTLEITGNHRFTDNTLRTGSARWTGYRDSDALIRQDVAYAATITPDLALGRWVRITLTGDLTLNAPINLQDGDEYVIELIQDAAGGHTVTFDSSYRRASTPSTTASSRSMLTFVRDSSFGRSIEKSAAIGST